uniref:Uncharacterized protein n=1 Tax=Ascaris lumbricoides TaxID=6252 RepID=A0A9J2PB83_ASCLU
MTAALGTSLIDISVDPSASREMLVTEAGQAWIITACPKEEEGGVSKSSLALDARCPLEPARSSGSLRTAPARNMIVILLFVLHVETASSLSGEHQNCEPLLEPLAIAYKLHNDCHLYFDKRQEVEQFITCLEMASYLEATLIAARLVIDVPRLIKNFIVSYIYNDPYPPRREHLVLKATLGTWGTLREFLDCSGKYYIIFVLSPLYFDKRQEVEQFITCLEMASYLEATLIAARLLRINKIAFDIEKVGGTSAKLTVAIGLKSGRRVHYLWTSHKNACPKTNIPSGNSAQLVALELTQWFGVQQIAWKVTYQEISWSFWRSTDSLRATRRLAS